MEIIKALSIKQPWASLIAHGIKDIENRTWKTNFRGKIYIHVSASKKFNISLNDEQTKLALPVLTTAFDGFMPFAAIIGEVDIIDCVINHPSIWAEKSCEATIYNWLLANPVLYDKPILNVKGKLSFWMPDFGICPKCHVTNIVTWEPGHHECLSCHFEFGN